MVILEAHDLYRFYHVGEEETLALGGVSLEIASGEMVAVQGPSGSGKSTLLSCLAGLDEPQGGYVTILGKRLTRKSEVERSDIRARSIGIMLQSGNLFEHLSVEDNIRLQLHLAGRKKSGGRVDELLATVGLEHVRRAWPAQISGGEAARVGVAVALSASPAVLFADEPTGEVDAETEQRILDLLDHHRKKGGAILIVTHSDAVASRADRVIHLNDGRIVDHDQRN
jgi:putative ABC transport system ATP-binding protein